MPSRRASQRPLREDGGLEALSSPLCRAFAVASAPAEHRESLPLSLSFVVWLEQSVLGVTTSSAQVLRLGFVLVCVWASLRWGDSLWDHFGCLPPVSNTKCQSMPWWAPPSAPKPLNAECPGWSLRFLSGLCQAVSDTLALQPDRILDFLPAVLSGNEDRPIFSEPWDRERFVPWLRNLLCQHWNLHSSAPLPSVFSLVAAQSLKLGSTALHRVRVKTHTRPP